jgi:hypothetical protein
VHKPVPRKKTHRLRRTETRRRFCRAETERGPPALQARKQQSKPSDSALSPVSHPWRGFLWKKRDEHSQATNGRLRRFSVTGSFKRLDRAGVLRRVTRAAAVYEKPSPSGSLPTARSW